MAVNKIKSNSGQNMQIQWLRSVHAEIAVEIAPHQQSKDAGQSGSNRSGARTLGSTRGLARGSSQHRFEQVYKSQNFIFPSFLIFSFSLLLSNSLTLSLPGDRRWPSAAVTAAVAAVAGGCSAK